MTTTNGTSALLASAAAARTLVAAFLNLSLVADADVAWCARIGAAPVLPERRDGKVVLAEDAAAGASAGNGGCLSSGARKHPRRG